MIHPRLLVLAGLVAGVSGCSSTQSLVSQRVTSAVAVDGSEADWQSNLQPVKDHDGLMMGVRNDGQDLYVALVVSNETTARQIALGGLTVWFDPDGGKKKTLGVQFPLGITDRSGGLPPGFDPGAEGGRGRPAEVPMPSFARLALRHGDDDEGTPQPAASATGVTAAGSLNAGQLVLELRIPLRGTDDAIGAAPGDQVGIGLETPGLQRPDRRERPAGGRGGPPSGGGGFPGGGPPGGGMGGPPGGGMGGRPGGPGGPQMPEPLDSWVRVTLAGA